jgi:PIN domain nuclease of toxin-antitoxin system
MSQVSVEVQAIDLPHRDPADRLLAATTRHGLALMTVDRRLATVSWLPTRSM